MKRKEAIKKLRSGEIQIENDLLPSTKEIKKLLKKAFPDDHHIEATPDTLFLKQVRFYTYSKTYWISDDNKCNESVKLSSITKPKTKKRLKQLEKGYSELKSLVSVPNEVKFEPDFENVMAEDISGWYKDKKHPKWIMYFDYENKKYYGFDINGDWHTAKENHVMRSIKRGESLCTPQEVEQALIAEAKKRGYKNGVDYLFGLAKQQRTLTSSIFRYKPNYNALLLGNDAIFQGGIWATILEETPIKEDEIDWSKPQKVISIATNTIIQTTGKNTDKYFEGIVIIEDIYYTENYIFDFYKPSFKKFKGTLTINKP